MKKYRAGKEESEPDPDRLSSHELIQLVHALLKTPQGFQLVNEGFAARIYLRCQQIAAAVDVGQQAVILGPYSSLELSDDKICARGTETDDDVVLVLAERAFYDRPVWLLNDGLSEEGTEYELVEIFCDGVPLEHMGDEHLKRILR